MWNLKKPKETERRKMITRGWDVGNPKGMMDKILQERNEEFLVI